VNGRSRPVIFEDMKRRIERGDIKAERSEAIKVCLLYLNLPLISYLFLSGYV
jgi:hypothetical protein